MECATSGEILPLLNFWWQASKPSTFEEGSSERSAIGGPPCIRTLSTDFVDLDLFSLLATE